MAIETNSSQYLHRGRKYLRTSTQLRLAQQGPQSLSDTELLSLVLRAGPGTSAHDLGLNLLTHLGSLRALFQASRQAARAQGVTFENFTVLHAALDLARRHYQELMKAGPVLTDLRTIREFIRMRLRDLPHEIFAALYLDHRNRVLHFQELFRGSIDSTTVYPREVVKEALAHNATSIIVAHNHPSGIEEPSQADQFMTRLLRQALATVEIRLLDHLIVGDGVVTSMAERGFL